MDVRGSMSIYRADSRDAEAIMSVVNKSNSEAYVKIIPPGYFKEPILTPDEFLKESKEMTFYACRVKETTVGVAALKIVGDEIGQLCWVYVLPEYQRKGVGTSLIGHIENEAVKMKLRKLRLLTNEKAYWARSFYQKLGYIITGRIARLWGDDIVYGKTLTERTP